MALGHLYRVFSCVQRPARYWVLFSTALCACSFFFDLLSTKYRQCELPRVLLSLVMRSQDHAMDVLEVVLGLFLSPWEDISLGAPEGAQEPVLSESWGGGTQEVCPLGWQAPGL